MGRSRWETDIYLPFWRVSHEAGEMRPGKDKGGAIDLIKRLHGGTENIGDPIENMFRNTQMLVDASITANARRKVVDEIVKAEGSARFLVRLPKEDKSVRVSTEEVLQRFWAGLGVNYGMIRRGAIPADMDPEVVSVIEEAFENQGDFMKFMLHGQAPVGGTVVAVMRKGKPEYYEVADPLLFRALMSLPRQVIGGPILNGLKMFRRVGQATVTYALDFWYRNLVRDQFMAGTLSRHGYKPFIDGARGLKHRAASDPVYQQYIASGGGLAGFYAQDADIHRHLETFYKKHGIGYEAVANIRHDISQDRWPADYRLRDRHRHGSVNVPAHRPRFPAFASACSPAYRPLEYRRVVDCDDSQCCGSKRFESCLTSRSGSRWGIPT